MDPSKPGSQVLNKRVDIVVASSLTEENKRLLDRVIYDRAHPVGLSDDGGHGQTGAKPQTAAPTAGSNVVRTGKGIS